MKKRSRKTGNYPTAKQATTSRKTGNYTTAKQATERGLTMTDEASNYNALSDSAKSYYVLLCIIMYIIALRVALIYAYAISAYARLT